MGIVFYLGSIGVAADPVFEASGGVHAPAGDHHDVVSGLHGAGVLLVAVNDAAAGSK